MNATERASAFAIAKVEHDRLEAVYRAALAVLNAIPGGSSGPMGLTPESVRLTPEYRSAYFAVKSAMAAQRKFAGPFVKMFKKELTAERDAKRLARYAAYQAAHPDEDAETGETSAS